MTWEPGAKRDWQHMALFGIVTFALGLGVTVWEFRAEIGRFLVSAAPWWFLPVTAAVIGIGFFVWLIWWQSRPVESDIFCADESRKPWEE